MIRLILQVFCAIFSGFMEATAISNEILPAGSPFLALLCLVPLYPALYSAKKYRESFGILFVQALTVHLISSYWLANFHDFAIFTLGASAVAEAFMAGLCGIVMFLYPSHRTQAKVLEESGGRRQYASFLRALWFAASWTFWEWIKSTGFLAYPWGTISMAAYSWKILTQIASVTGVWGITFIYALFNALLGEGIILLSTTNYAQSKRTMIATWRTEAVFVSVIFGTVALYGAAEYFMPRTPVKALNTIGPGTTSAMRGARNVCALRKSALSLIATSLLDERAPSVSGFFLAGSSVGCVWCSLVFWYTFLGSFFYGSLEAN